MSRQLPLADCVGQVGHPLRRLRADRLQGYPARVHALEQAGPEPNSTGASAIVNSSIRPAFTYSRIVAPPPARRTSRSPAASRPGRGRVRCRR